MLGYRPSKRDERIFFLSQSKVSLKESNLEPKMRAKRVVTDEKKIQKILKN